MKTNIVLIGMPASGKSTAGVIMAKVLGMDFIDADLVIQKAEGKRLEEIIDEKGVDGFIETENRINSGINAENTVIATGGSAVYGKEEMEHFKEIGYVIYLKVDYDTLTQRLGDIKQRGVVVRDGQTFRDLYEERIKLYEKYADIVVDEAGKNVEQIVVAAAEAWQKKRNS
ncbi:shikimate kinase [Lachnospiraceae bacterium KH1T2]|nr:shikimate kinase [Lachnospiraceae bacterium KH1T2]